MMTKKDAITYFNRYIKPAIPTDDKPALWEAWNIYTDGLCKDGEITDKQYNNWSHPFCKEKDIL